MRVFEDERDITSFFANALRNAAIAVSVDYTNSNSEPTATGEWESFLVRFRVSRLPDSRLIATSGTYKHYRNYGSVMVQLVGPHGEGSARFGKLADRLSTFFVVGHRIGGIHFKTPSAGPLIEEKSRSSLTVSVPYQSDFKVDREGNIVQ